MNKHCFALYYANASHQISQLNSERLLSITHEHILHRLNTVLRARRADEFILFDHAVHIKVVIEEINKKKVIFQIKDHEKNELLMPAINYWMPLIKREALFEAVYALVEAGVSQINLVATNKSTLKWQEKDLEKLKTIIISACEQSKNFNIPHIDQPKSLAELLLAAQDSNIIFCDPSGGSFFSQINRLREEHLMKIIVMSGPEADLSEAEKQLLRDYNAFFAALTPTILRAKQVPGHVTAMIRSLL